MENFLKLATKLKEQQKRVVEKLRKSPGLLAYHSMGSGKTLTGLAAIEDYHKQNKKNKNYVIAPASVVNGFKEELKSKGIKIDPKKIQFMSYETASNKSEEILKQDLGMVVFDEAHKLRNTQTKRFQKLLPILMKSEKRLLLSGTPSYNNIDDFKILVNLAAGKEVLPKDKKDFESKFIDKSKEERNFISRMIFGEGETKKILKNKGELKKKISPYVDYYDALEAASKDFPEKVEEKVEVEMDENQKKYYDFVMGSVPTVLQYKIRSGLPLNKKELMQLNSFSTGVRQVSNSVTPYVGETTQSNKTKKIVEDIKDELKKNKKFRGVVYSNYLDAGLNPVKNLLDFNKIPNQLFTGSLNAEEKKKVVDEFNSDTKKPMVLLLSSSGAEGLNLKGTNMVQVMEPHFNKSKTDQVVARGVRFKSHEHLPQQQRVVSVKHYLSKNPDTFFSRFFPSQTKASKTIDQYLYEMSESKNDIVDDLKDVVKKI